ncbi:hypothetical protein LCGC14_1659550, partial [marine sediment metagenome]
KTNRLHIGRHSVIHTKGSAIAAPVHHIVEKETIIEKELDEEKMADIIRKVLAEKKEVPVEKPKPQTDIKEEVQKAVKSGMKDLISSIRDQISSVNVNPQQSKEIDMPIDPAKFAEISQKAIDKVSKDIETGEAKTPKKVQFKIGDLKDLADEIE